MSDMIVPGIPGNVRIPTHLKGVRLMESDVFQVCERIREIDPNLYVVVHDGTEKPFVVMEHCIDGEERMVKRYERLDSSILTDLQRMLNIPWKDRFKQLAREIDDHNAAQERAWEDSEQHDKFIWDMGKALRESGIATGRVAPVHMFRGHRGK